MADSRQKELLARWREGERRLAAADPTSRKLLAAEVRRVRREYFAAVEAVWLAVRERDDEAASREIDHPTARSHSKRRDAEVA